MERKEIIKRMRPYFQDAFRNGRDWAEIKNLVVIERVQGDANTLKDVLEAVLRKASETPPKLDFSGFALQKLLTEIKDQKLEQAETRFLSYCVSHLSRGSGS